MVVAVPTEARAALDPFRWTTPGSKSWTVPDGVHEVWVDIAGGAGGNQPINNSQAWGGRGARLQGFLEVDPGTTMSIYVGAAGEDGEVGGGADSGGEGGTGWFTGGDGGSGSYLPAGTLGQGGGGGGGSSYIGRPGYVMDVHAGGGGGAGGHAWCGGNPGGDAGHPGSKVSSSSCVSNGGDPGAAGVTTGPGADGKNASSSSGQGGGGGGGGGARGGGGGDASTDGGGGGGGGTSDWSSRFSLEWAGYGSRAEHGFVEIRPVYSTAVTFDTPSYEVVAGQDVTFAGTVGYLGVDPGPAPEGSVELSVGSGTAWFPIGTVPVTGGSFTLTCGAPCGIAASDTTVRADFYPNAIDWTASSTTADLAIVEGETTTTLTAEPETVVVGQERELVAHVAVLEPALGPATGDVDFWAVSPDEEESELLGSASLDATGEAVLVATTPFLGEHTVHATFRGSDWFAESESDPVPVTTERAGTEVAVVAVPEPSLFGQDVQIEAEVSSLVPEAGVPAGEVEIAVGEEAAQVVTLDSGTAQVTVPGGRDAGTWPVRVRYLGSEHHEPSETLVTHVVEQGQVDLTLAQDATSTRFGQTVTLTVEAEHVAPASGQVRGEVEIWADGEPTGARGTLEDSRTQIPLTGLAVGTRTLEARFTGSVSSAPATSNLLVHEVSQAGTAVTLEPDRDTITVGTDAVLRVLVQPDTPAEPSGGEIDIFYAGPHGPTGRALGSAPLVSGVAEVVVPRLDVGQHELLAVYRGTAGLAAGSSRSEVVEVVEAASTTALVAPREAGRDGRVVVTARVETLESALSAPLGSGLRPAPGATVPTRPGQWVPFVAPGAVQLIVDGEPSGAPARLVPAGRTEPGVATAVWTLSLAPGEHVVEAEYLGTRTVLASRADATTIVVAPTAPRGPERRGPGRLPRTGGEPVELIVLSGALTVLGALVLIQRRRIAG